MCRRPGPAPRPRTLQETGPENRIRSIAFPAISCGVYGYPVKAAARIAVEEVTVFLAEHELPRIVRFVCFDDRTRAAYSRAMEP